MKFVVPILCLYETDPSASTIQIMFNKPFVCMTCSLRIIRIGILYGRYSRSPFASMTPATTSIKAA